MGLDARDALVHIAQAAMALALLGAAAACEDSSNREAPAPVSTTAAATPVAMGAPEATPTATATTASAPTSEPTPPATLAPSHTPDPTSTVTPAPSSTPDPTPTATPARAPTPHPGVAFIEPTSGAFEHRTFKSGADIDWSHGIFVTDPESGLTDGYRVPGAQPGHDYGALGGAWILSRDLDGSGLLLHRLTGRAWRWPPGDSDLRIAAASAEHVLFEELDGFAAFTGRFFIADSQMDVVGRFSISVQATHVPHALFSPDGTRIAVSGHRAVYLVPVASAQPEVLFDAGRMGEAWISIFSHDPSRIPVGARRHPESPTEYQAFTWDGVPQPEPSCPYVTSPDGQYAVGWQGGGPGTTHSGGGPPESLRARASLPWPSVVVISTDACTPLFVVDSAWWDQLAASAWPHNWLSTSDRVIIGTRDGYAILRIGSSPSLTPIPALRPGARPDRVPHPALTGDGRYIGYGPNVYDLVEDQWAGPGEIAPGQPWWGVSGHDRWFVIRALHDYSEYTGVLLEPKVALPPFDNAHEITLRVAGTGDCLHLRQGPRSGSRSMACLADNERLVLAYPDRPPGASGPLHRSVDLAEGQFWVYVRTEDGTEGWVSHDYLEHD